MDEMNEYLINERNEYLMNPSAVDTHGLLADERTRMEVNVGITPRDIRSFIKSALSPAHRRSVKYIKWWILRKGNTLNPVDRSEIMRYLHVAHGINSVSEVSFLTLVDRIHLCIFSMQNSVPIRRFYRPGVHSDWSSQLHPMERDVVNQEFVYNTPELRAVRRGRVYLNDLDDSDLEDELMDVQFPPLSFRQNYYRGHRDRSMRNLRLSSAPSPFDPTSVDFRTINRFEGNRNQFISDNRGVPVPVRNSTQDSIRQDHSTNRSNSRSNQDRSRHQSYTRNLRDHVINRYANNSNSGGNDRNDYRTRVANSSWARSQRNTPRDSNVSGNSSTTARSSRQSQGNRSRGRFAGASNNRNSGGSRKSRNSSSNNTSRNISQEDFGGNTGGWGNSPNSSSNNTQENSAGISSGWGISQKSSINNSSTTNASKNTSVGWGTRSSNTATATSSSNTATATSSSNSATATSSSTKDQHTTVAVGWGRSQGSAYVFGGNTKAKSVGFSNVKSVGKNEGNKKRSFPDSPSNGNISEQGSFPKNTNEVGINSATTSNERGQGSSVLTNVSINTIPEEEQKMPAAKKVKSNEQREGVIQFEFNDTNAPGNENHVTEPIEFEFNNTNASSDNDRELKDPPKDI